jgi:hypothetical protein
MVFIDYPEAIQSFSVLYLRKRAEREEKMVSTLSKMGITDENEME